MHLTAMFKVSALGKINEAEEIEVSLIPKVKVYDCPVFEKSLELSTILNDPSAFFVIVANPPGAVVATVEASVPSVVFGQIAGVTTHAGRLSSSVSVTK